MQHRKTRLTRVQRILIGADKGMASKGHIASSRRKAGVDMHDSGKRSGSTKRPRVTGRPGSRSLAEQFANPDRG